nr:uncharacterized protein LOC127296738 isoform X2 [Lolium perenne]
MVVILGEDLVMNCPQGFQNAWFHQIMMLILGCHMWIALGIAYHLVIKHVTGRTYLLAQAGDCAQGLVVRYTDTTAIEKPTAYEYTFKKF